MTNETKKIITAVLIIWALWVASAAAMYYYMIAPAKHRASDLHQQLNETAKAVEELEKAKTEQFQQQLNQKVADCKNKVKDFVIKTGKADQLMFNISQIAKDLRVDQFASRDRSRGNYEDISGCDRLKIARIDVEFSSDFIDFARFINYMERNDPIVFIDNFSIGRTTTSSREAKAQVGLEVLVDSAENEITEDIKQKDIRQAANK
jgi:hypothetical protein